MRIHSGRSGGGLLLRGVACMLILCGAGFQCVGAQVPAASATLVRRHRLGLEAQSVANGGASQVTGNASGLALAEASSVLSFGDRRVASNRTNIKISVRNYGTASDNVRVEWFFVALPVNESATGNHEFIFYHDAQTLGIPGGKTATQVVSSPEVQAVYERGATITAAPAGHAFYGGYTSLVSLVNAQKGLTIRGWMVRLVAEDGSVIAAKGSGQNYEDIAANPAKLAGMRARPGAGAR